MDSSRKTVGPSPAAPKRGGASAVFWALVFLAAGAMLGVFYQTRRGERFAASGAADNVSDQFVHNGYYPLAETMAAAGYRPHPPLCTRN